MKVTVEILEAEQGFFSKIYLVTNSIYNSETKVLLQVNDFSPLYDLTRDINSIRLDLLIISMLIYGIDNLFNRRYFSVDGWSREIEVEFPVYNLTQWKGTESHLEETLSFLTGDFWTINFVKNTTHKLFIPRRNRQRRSIRRFNHSKIKATSLFSGGLDSLIGVIDILEKLNVNEEILMVSHFDFKSSGPNKDQKNLYDHLIQKYPKKLKYNWLQLKLALSRYGKDEEKINVETNYRSRSFLFIALGSYLSPSNNLIIPENGTISINYPLTPSRVSSLSTRTTHPFVIKNIQTLYSKLNINVILDNPYKFKTKGEMISKCRNKSILLESVSKSTSCGKPIRDANKCANKSAKKHCGVCMPCIYRRAALHKENIDNYLHYCNNIEKAVISNSFTDLPALLYYLKKDFTLEDMKRGILVNGRISQEELDEYAELILRSREELKQFFRDKGNNFIETELRLR